MGRRNADIVGPVCEQEIVFLRNWPMENVKAGDVVGDLDGRRVWNVASVELQRAMQTGGSDGKRGSGRDYSETRIDEGSRASTLWRNFYASPHFNLLRKIS